MIWECSSCGHQVVGAQRPSSCRFCGCDVTFFVAYCIADVLARGGRVGICSMRPKRDSW